MINDYPSRTKYLIIAVITAVFVSSLVFAYVMMTSDYASKDGQRALTYAAVFALILVGLNVLLLVIALRASKKMKKEAMTVRCASCGSPISKDLPRCEKCGSVNVTDDTYLDPKNDEPAVTPKPKRKEQ